MSSIDQKRDDFPKRVKDELAKRVGFLCSNPGCRQSTSGPHSGKAGTVNIGVAAHITAASAGGPRYDPTMQSGERSSAENGIWFCQTCAKLIDDDSAKYTIDKLRQWKSDAEAAAARALENRREPATESEGVFLEAERLMPDLIADMRSDVQKDDTELVREFIILHSPKVIFSYDKKCFVYFKSGHPNLRIQVDWLEEMGVVVDITPKETPIYRMVPEFVDWLRGST